MIYRLNAPQECTFEQIKLLVQQIPVATTLLDLSHNDLNRFSASELVALFKLIPSTVLALDLRDNGFGEFKSIEELKLCFAALPLTLRRLNLNYNCFTGKTTDQLLQIFAEPAKHLSQLHLKNKNIDDSEVIADFPQSIKGMLCLDDDFLDQIDFQAQNLMKWLSHAIQNGNKTDLAYGHIQLRAPLNTSLQHILQALITKNTPLAFFCYALLLTGKINSAHAKENSLKEKRILKAIDYFVFAAKDPLLQPHINFLLWHIKTTSPFFWVSKKIDRLNKFTIPTDVLLSSTISGSYLAKQSHTFFRPEIGKDNWSIRGIAGSRCSLQNIKRK